MKKLIALILTFTMLFALTTGCSNAQKGETTTATSAGAAPKDTEAVNDVPAAAATDGDPLVIGWIVWSTNNELFDAERQILDACAERVNAAGGINGQQVKIEYFDGGTDQQAYTDGMLLALENKELDCMIGTLLSQYAFAVSDYVKQEKIPVFNLATNYMMAENNEYYYIQRPVDKGTAKALAQIAIDEGCKSPTLVLTNSSSNIQQGEWIQAYFEAKGLKIADTIVYDRQNTTDFTSLVLKAINNPDSDGLILFCGTDVDGQSFATITRQYDYEYPIVVNGALFDMNFVDTVGADAVEGWVGYSEYANTLDTEENKEFLAFLEEINFNYAVSMRDACVYDCFNLYCEAATLGGGNDRESVNNGLKMIQDFKGVLSTYSWHSDNCFTESVYLTKFVNGEMVVGASIDVPHED